MSKNYSGLSAALLTPFNDKNEVDHGQLRKLVRFLINQGIDGFYVGGSTGEAFLLSKEERKAILETVLDENAGEKLVTAHVGHISTDYACDLAKHAREAGADAISAISPFYYPFTQEEIKGYYGAIMECGKLPMVIYNFPAYSGVTMTNSLLRQIRQLGHVAGVKFTGNDFYQMERMKAENPDLFVWNGLDEMLFSGLAAGADGGVGSTYNCMLPLIRGVFQNFREGKVKEAGEYQKKVNAVIEVIARHGIFASEKELLRLWGIDCGKCRSPFMPLGETGKQELKAVFETYIAGTGR